MSEFEMDKLFRQKLADKKVKPSYEAWEKLSAGLKKEQKGKTLLYWPVAASVVFLLGFGVYFFNDNTDTRGPVAENKPQVQDAFPEENRLDQNAPVKIAEKKTVEATERQAVRKKTVKKNFALKSAKKETSSKTLLPQPLETEPAIAEKVPENIMETRHKLAEAPENTQLEEVTNQPLNNNQPLLAATRQQDIPTTETPEKYPEIKIIYKSSKKNNEDKSTFHKVIELAKDVKQAEIGLGTLREAKNDLLAFGFKKTKNN